MNQKLRKTTKCMDIMSVCRKCSLFKTIKCLKNTKKECIAERNLAISSLKKIERK